MAVDRLAAGAFLRKIDRFMQNHVIPFFNPEEIFWWFSLSGGKDSHSMALGVRRWYQQRSLVFSGCGFHITQWSPNVAKQVASQVDWMPVIDADARVLTRHYVGYSYGDQAPCRKCADVRRMVNDQLIYDSSQVNGKINFIARGLHLSDTAISLLWRYILGGDPVKDFVQSGKGCPVVSLWPRTFLAKPLFYVREYESQQYARCHGIQTACCGCPACKFPSRRDIVEETILPIIHGSLWEFSIPGLKDLLSKMVSRRQVQQTISESAPGVETKCNRLPRDFGFFSVRYFKQRISTEMLSSIGDGFCPAMDLDLIGFKRLRDNSPLLETSRIPIPSILQSNRVISEGEAGIIGALGPFWGALGLRDDKRKQALTLQQALFGFRLDERWGHTHQIVKQYYQKNHDAEKD